MAVTIQWDEVDGPSITLDTATLEITRAGTVLNISTAQQSDPLALIRALEAMLSTSPFSAPGTIGTWLKSMVVKPSNATDQARVFCTWTGPSPLPKTGVRWVVEDKTTLTTEQEQVDQNGYALATVYQGPNVPNPNPSAGSGGGSLVSVSEADTPPNGLAYPVNESPLRPRRIITITGYIYGPPGASVLTCPDAVNQVPWPTTSLFTGDQPLPRGYWLCTDAGASLEGKGLYGRTPVNLNQMLYSVNAEFMTKIVRDWSKYDIYRNVKGLIPPDLMTPKMAGQRAALMAAPYTYGAITGQIAANGSVTFPNGAVNGFLKWGPYRVVNWVNIFGF